MDAFTGLHIAKGTYNPVQLPEYKERVSYDANGNIKTYIRNGDKARLNMDSLLYIYQPNNNQLTQVLDYMPDNNLYNDLKSGQAANNYSYDAIGNLIADQQEGISAIKWNVYGKIASINKSTGAINYFYDASGNRVMKQTPADTVAYVRDASGNVLSVYNKNKNGLVQQSETYLYGSSRLGVVRAQRVAPKIMKLNVSFNDAKLGVFTRGEKIYELSNHLQNVLTTVSDKRLPVTKNNDTVVSGYTAVVVSASDYYPFGMEMVGRNYSTYNTYRYGFNGKENDKEIEGQQDYGFRIYDKRLGKFKSVDPLSPKYPELTPYQFASNRPIDGIDLDGLEYLDAKKYKNGAVWGIQKFKISSSDYTISDLLLKNKIVHNLIISHPDNKKPYGVDRPDDPGEVNTMSVKQRANSAKSQAFSSMEAATARKEGAADIVGGVVDFIKWSIKTGYNIKYSEELNYGGASILALNNADNLVRDAVGNHTFPKNLLNPSVLTDLTNYLTDGSKPNAGLYYDNVIATWGDLLYNNRAAVNTGNFNFSPLKTLIKTLNISGPSDIKVSIFAFEKTGNPDPAVNRANKLIEKDAPQRPITVSQKK